MEQSPSSKADSHSADHIPQQWYMTHPPHSPSYGTYYVSKNKNQDECTEDVFAKTATELVWLRV